jgi:glycosyltransferase involved in cell wall biosynthesis
MEARKFPRELVSAFRAARHEGVEAQLHFIGRPSASDASINAYVSQAVAENIGVRWTTDASDEEVREHVEDADVFLSFGTEGYGIPVLEALRRRLPVVFGGVQPAAQLMVGSGAVEVAGTSEQDLTDMFRTFSDLATVKESQISVDPGAVPTWRDFARSVAQAVC